MTEKEEARKQEIQERVDFWKPAEEVGQGSGSGPLH